MFDALTYQKRRKALREKVGSGIILILGNNEAPANYPDNTYKFRQDSSFVYFFGHSHPGYAGIIDADSGEEYFFGNDVDMDDIILDGSATLCERTCRTGGSCEKFSVRQTERNGKQGSLAATEGSLLASIQI